MIDPLVPPVVREMQNENNRDPLVPMTLRLPPELEKEIREFAYYNDLPISVTLRKIVSLGWLELLSEIEEG